jgi:hypothetical protein
MCLNKLGLLLVTVVAREHTHCGELGGILMGVCLEGLTGLGLVLGDFRRSFLKKCFY